MVTKTGLPWPKVVAMNLSCSSCNPPFQVGRYWNDILPALLADFSDSMASEYVTRGHERPVSPAQRFETRLAISCPASRLSIPSLRSSAIISCTTPVGRRSMTSRLIESSTVSIISDNFSVRNSASSIQNSLTCRGVSLLSARNVGERVQTLGCSLMYASRCNWDDTVRYLGSLKKWLGSCVDRPFASVTEFDDTVKTSPAPSQSDDVMIGGWRRIKPWFRK